MGEGYRELLAAADADPNVRAIVVTGAGRGFCARIDVAALVASRPRSAEERDRAREARSFAPAGA
jgi:enoyl-CoA hydratase/carnithine racemase